ncbi:MAG: hypothetical protein M0P63_06005 [Azoarcus sp.]|nr:hypothetical protein [Azoarcus sp.]
MNFVDLSALAAIELLMTCRVATLDGHSTFCLHPRPLQSRMSLSEKSDVRCQHHCARCPALKAKIIADHGIGTMINNTEAR